MTWSWAAEKIENFMTAVVHFFGATFNTVQILYRKNLMDIVMMVEKDREVTRSKVKIAYKAMEEATKTPEKKKIKEKNKEEEEEEELKEWVDNTFTCQSISYIPHDEEEDKMDFLIPGAAEEVSVEAGATVKAPEPTEEKEEEEVQEVTQGPQPAAEGASRMRSRAAAQGQGQGHSGLECLKRKRSKQGKRRKKEMQY